MSFSLTQKPCNYLYFKGKKFYLTLYFDRVLACLEILHDKTLLDEDKVFLSLALLTSNSYKASKNDKPTLLSIIFKKHINISSEKPANELPCFDFIKDASLIYAAFLSAYNIDLHKSHGKLHWHCFISLFSALPKNTKLYEVMQIRTTPIPAPNKYNLDYIQNLRSLKMTYAIDNTNMSSKVQFNSSLKSLADDYRRQAEILLMKG